MLKIFRIFIIIIFAYLLAPISAAAHPADMYFQTQTVHLTSQGATMEWTLFPGPMLIPWVWSDADQDQDRKVSGEEARAWVEKQLPHLTVALDGTPLAWQLEAVEWPDTQADFQVGDQLITVHLKTHWPQDLAGQRHLSLHNRYEDAVSIYWFILHGDKDVAFIRPQQQNGLLEVVVALSETTGVAPTKAVALTYWDSGTPSLPAAGQPEQGPSISEPILPEAMQAGSPSAILTDLVRREDLSFTFYLVALAVAAVLGALHSLTPGHGKTVVAAYLVGSRGTTRHAIFLGSIVTLTHTGSVFLLGLITLFASQYILPTSLFPVLEIASGVLILALGAHLLYQRGKAWRMSRLAADAHNHAHHHSHDHDHHDHAHDHSHNIPDPAELTWRSLLALGVSGGLVPCPDAIAILLVAIAINRIALGLSLIIAFSLGLALVLISIGLAMVHSRRLFEKMDAFSRLAPVMPVISALVVLALGVALTWGAVRNTGLLRPSSGGPAETLALSLDSTTTPPISIPFDPNSVAILYLDRDEEDHHQLFVVQAGEEPAPLTAEVFGVLDYALSPDGKIAAYTAQQKGGGSELRAVDMDGSNRRPLVDCSESPCGRGVWSPDGAGIVYERLAPPSASAPAGLTTLWWLDLTADETSPVFQDSQLPGYNPRWSPDGRWLSYTSPGSAGVQIYRLSGGRSLLVPNRLGSPVIWHPNSSALLMSDVLHQGNSFINHLMRFDLKSETLLDLTGNKNLEDSAASWSPDGEQIAVVRRKLAEGASTGNQLWLMAADGSAARPLTNMPDVVHSAPVWSPDGRYLLFHRYPLKVSSMQSGIYWLNVETGKVQEVVSSGSRPVWVTVN